MDWFMEDRDGQFREWKGICGAEPGPRLGDDLRFPARRPCILPEGHAGSHESLVPRRVFDTLVWERPNARVIDAEDGEPRTIKDGGA